MLSIGNVNKYNERNEMRSQFCVPLRGEMDFVTVSYAGVAGSSPTEKEQNLWCISRCFMIPPIYIKPLPSRYPLD